MDQRVPYMSNDSCRLSTRTIDAKVHPSLNLHYLYIRHDIHAFRKNSHKQLAVTEDYRDVPDLLRPEATMMALILFSNPPSLACVHAGYSDPEGFDQIWGFLEKSCARAREYTITIAIRCQGEDLLNIYFGILRLEE
ncbi:hypothetical protein H4R35_001661 [Dimargaris xerosporica]|nr:hypothetical protein H4R35_001661 [Dimargaris xerosporica]